jgi:hypothetical protein
MLKRLIGPVRRLLSRRRILAGVAVIGILGFGLDLHFTGRFRSKASSPSPHFELTCSSDHSTEQVSDILERLESNYQRIGDALKTVPPAKVMVILYDNRWAYSRATGHWGASGNIEGPEKLHVLWEGDKTAENAVHEFAHAVTLKLLLDREPRPLDSKVFEEKFTNRFPVWLWESVACYHANQLQDVGSLPYVRPGRYPSLSELNQRGKGGKVYQVGYTIAEFILVKWGSDALVRLIAEYGDVRKALAMNEEEFWLSWCRFVRTKYVEGQAR